MKGAFCLAYKNISLTQGSEGHSCASSSRYLILPKGGQRSALWSQAWIQKWSRPLRGVSSHCRSVPQAWWMKRPSKSSTHSSSPREVSPWPGLPHDFQALTVPLFWGGSLMTIPTFLATLPFWRGPDAASDLPERNHHRS